MAETIFYISLILIFYTYFGYPLILCLLSLFLKRKVKRETIYPEVTVVIPVHNEEKSIGGKIENCLSFYYPKEKLKIIVASDGSTDRTEEIVKGFDPQQVQFLSLPYRGGKVSAQNYAVQSCDSDIIIFSDVAILTHSNSVKLIVENFADPKVGVVSCKDAIVGEKPQKRGETSYIRYDMMVRKYISNIGSLIGVTGGFYAVRKEIAKGGWNPAFPPDFYVAIRCIKRGMRVIEDPRVIAYYRTAAKEWDELQRKVRTINRGMHAFFSISNRPLLNPFRFGIMTLELVSHKLLRWMTPFFLIALFIANLLIMDHSLLLKGAAGLQAGIYLMATLAFVASKRDVWSNERNLFRYANYFAIANMAILKAWFEFFSNKKYMTWQPTKR